MEEEEQDREETYQRGVKFNCKGGLMILHSYIQIILIDFMTLNFMHMYLVLRVVFLGITRSQ